MRIDSALGQAGNSVPWTMLSRGEPRPVTSYRSAELIMSAQQRQMAEMP